MNSPEVDTKFRFNVGDTVWVRDRRLGRGGYRLVEATVEERSYEIYNNWPEWYLLDGDLYWREYPGCRVFRTREEARKTRLSR
jgi:hypothetical protein